jgi:hypothetical protein
MKTYDCVDHVASHSSRIDIGHTRCEDRDLPMSRSPCREYYKLSIMAIISESNSQLEETERLNVNEYVHLHKTNSLALIPQANYTE